MRRSRLGWAGLISLLLHAALLALLWEQAPVRPPSPPPATPPLVVEILTPPAEPPAPPPPAPSPPPPARPQPPRTRPRPTPPPEPKPAEPAPSAPESPPPDALPPLEGDAAEAEAARPALPADAPLTTEVEKPSLLPPMPEEGWSLPAPAEKPRGRTIRPDDPSLSPEVLAAEERARVTARVQTFAEDDLATLRVENGLVHPYFSEVRAALERQLEGAPLFDTKGGGMKGTAQRLARSYLKQAEQYGATGTLGGPKGPHGREPPTASERLAAISKGNPAHDSMRAFLQAGESVQQLAEPPPELVIILELRQTPEGQLRDVKVVEPSGNKAFDAYVLERVPPALARLAPPPEQAQGVREDGIRTLWAVEGRVVYLRKLEELEGQDAWYIASAAGLGVLAGRFEETTGEVYVIDLRNPKFVVRPRLLRVW
jgi:outer membrane biosynthesis protein TonB